MKSAARLQLIKDAWADRRAELDEALASNRKLWTVLVTGVTAPESQVPLEIKQNIVNLGMFIFNHSLALSVEAEPDPARLDVLININRQIAGGLRERPQPGTDGTAA